MKQAIRTLMTEPWDSYEEAKRRSQVIDDLLGFRIQNCESTLERVHGRVDWAHLSEQSFQTPYPELAQITRAFAIETKLRWTELGAGYGRLGLVLSWLRPQDHYFGFEFVAERVREGQRIFRT